MKTKKLMAGALPALFSVVLAVNAFAAGRNQGGTTGGSGGIVTLDVYSGPANTSGIQANSYWTDILREDLGIQINLVPQSGDLFNAMLASGELADVVIVHNSSQTLDMLRGGLLLNLDEHRAQLPNLYANIPSAVQYMRDNVSNGTGALYAVPGNVSNRPQQAGKLYFGPYLRWELYKEAGMPVINEIEDYLPLLKKMVDAHPVNDAGQKNYGLIGFPDWDDGKMFLASLISSFYGGSTGQFHEIDYTTNTTRSILDDNSWYKRGLKFWFTANQMGLVDPDSVNQGYPDYLVKATAGRLFFCWWAHPWGWGDFDTPDRAQQRIGYQLVPFTRQKQNLGTPGYVGTTLAQVSKNTKKMDAALSFLDYMYSYDGVLNLYAGRKGIFWDQDPSGEPYVTQTGWNIRNRVRDFPNGGKEGDGIWVINWHGLGGVLHPALNREIFTSDWIKKDFAPQDTALVADWKALMKAEDDLDYYRQHNMLVQVPFAPMNAAPDNILQIAARVGQVVQPVSWQMVYARDEAEFNRLWADMVQRAKGVGIDTVVQWYADEYNRARTSSAKYAK
ncbi:MAG: extracellular solute-binding protein [Treponema sp.]|jgi:putative aldouronate transport system substrate-binding protein|nr:extracellular solute-binding protein [Treponema sp.]